MGEGHPCFPNLTVNRIKLVFSLLSSLCSDILEQSFLKAMYLIEEEELHVTVADDSYIQ